MVVNLILYVINLNVNQQEWDSLGVSASIAGEGGRDLCNNGYNGVIEESECRLMNT